MKFRNFSVSLLTIGFLSVGLLLGGMAYASSSRTEDAASTSPAFKMSLQNAITDFEQANPSPGVQKNVGTPSNQIASPPTYGPKPTCLQFNTCQSPDCVFPTIDPVQCPNTSQTVSCVQKQQVASPPTYGPKPTCLQFNTCQSPDCVFPTIDPVQCPNTSQTVSCVQKQQVAAATYGPKPTCLQFNTCQSPSCVFPTIDPVQCPNTSQTTSCLAGSKQAE